MEKPYLIVNKTIDRMKPVLIVAVIFFNEGRIKEVPLPFPAGVRVKGLSNDGQRILFSANSMDAFEYDLRREALQSFHPTNFETAIFSPDDQFVAFTSVGIKPRTTDRLEASQEIFSETNELILQKNRLQKRIIPTLGDPKEMIRPIAFLSGDTLMVYLESSEAYDALDLNTGQQKQLFPGTQESGNVPIVSADGSRIVAIRDDQGKSSLMAMTWPSDKTRTLKLFEEQEKPRLLRFARNRGEFFYRLGRDIYKMSWEDGSQTLCFTSLPLNSAVGKEHVAWFSDKEQQYVVTHVSGHTKKVATPRLKGHLFSHFLVD